MYKHLVKNVKVKQYMNVGLLISRLAITRRVFNKTDVTQNITQVA